MIKEKSRTITLERERCKALNRDYKVKEDCDVGSLLKTTGQQVIMDISNDL